MLMVRLLLVWNHVDACGLDSRLMLVCDYAGAYGQTLARVKLRLYLFSGLCGLCLRLLMLMVNRHMLVSSHSVLMVRIMRAMPEALDADGQSTYARVELCRFLWFGLRLKRVRKFACALAARRGTRGHVDPGNSTPKFYDQKIGNALKVCSLSRLPYYQGVWWGGGREIGQFPLDR